MSLTTAAVQVAISFLFYSYVNQIKNRPQLSGAVFSLTQVSIFAGYRQLLTTTYHLLPNIPSQNGNPDWQRSGWFP